MELSVEAQVLLETIVQALVNGISVGCLYGLMCLGLGLIFGIMRVINFAQGDFMMLGMYAAFYAFGGFSLSIILGPSIGPIVAALIAGPVIYIVGIIMHRILISRVSGLSAATMENDGHNAQLILTLGIGLVLQNTGHIIFGSSPVSIRSPLSTTAWEIVIIRDQVSVIVNQARLISGLIAVGIAAILSWFIFYSIIGKSARAAANNITASIYMGIDVDRCHRIFFGLGAGVTAIAGGLLALYYPFQPYVGMEFIIVMYTGVVLGGLGSIAGAFWGGLIIGIIQQMSTLILPNQLQNTATFFVFLLIIFFRPNGIFGKTTERA